MISKSLLTAILLVVLPAVPATGETGKAPLKVYEPFGIALALSTNTIPYKNHKTHDTSLLVPLIYFENQAFFINGLEAGYKVFEGRHWRLSTIARIRRFNPPEEYSELGEDKLDIGGQLRYHHNLDSSLDIELMRATGDRFYGQIRFNKKIRNGNLILHPFAAARFKSDDFNSFQYGLDEEQISACIDFTLGIDGRYFFTDHVALIGGLSATLLDPQAAASQQIDTDWHGEIYAGIGYFNTPNSTRSWEKQKNSFIQIAHGWATISSVVDFAHADVDADVHNNQLLYIFYGHRVVDNLFDTEIDLYVTPGFVHHIHSYSQTQTQEYVLAVKAYYPFKTPFHWRVGAATGISYANLTPFVEKRFMQRHNYPESNILAYLNVSLGCNLGDLFNIDWLKDLWFGYNIHHRSGFFSSSNVYGQLTGGSNYHGFFLQYHF